MTNKIIMKLDNVSKGYGEAGDPASVTVLQNISLSIPAGETVAIVGPSGCGKSTLLNLMGALDEPDQGAVYLNDENLGNLSEGRKAEIRNREIGFVFQLHHLLPQCTVLENALIPTLPFRKQKAENAGDAAERARDLLTNVGLKKRLLHRPGQLSGGERQRVAVVRALINEPKLLLADEPTGSLDHTAATELTDLLIELNREKQVTMAVVTHSTELAEHMHSVYQLRDGRLHSSGKSE